MYPGGSLAGAGGWVWAQIYLLPKTQTKLNRNAILRQIKGRMLVMTNVRQDIRENAKFLKIQTFDKLLTNHICKEKARQSAGLFNVLSYLGFVFPGFCPGRTMGRGRVWVVP